MLVEAEHRKKKIGRTSIIGEVLQEKRGEKINQYEEGEESVAKNGKEMSKRSENRYRKKINVSHTYMYLWKNEMKMIKGMDNGSREKNN